MLEPILFACAAVAGLGALVMLVRLARHRTARRWRGVLAAAALLGFAAGTIGLGVLPPGAVASVVDQPSASPSRTATTAVALPTWRPADAHDRAGYAHITRWSIPVFPAGLRTTAAGTQTLPRNGEIGSVVIPATRSRFVARPAIVYLPPAALVPRPRLLPVIIAFSGQSRGAGPADLVWSAGLRSMMDGIAARHHGVAPVVVVPDQLGPASGNPMCVDSPLGHSATYVMTDVRDWILTHLPVATGSRDWTVAGFSQGGTCAIQFASAHPDVFGSVVDVSGEAAPIAGSEAHTIAVAFHGSTVAYLHASPAWLLAHHHVRGLQAYFAAGALDRNYGPVVRLMAAHAAAAGARVHTMRVAGLNHNWKVGRAGMLWGFDHLAGWWGL
ncbi:alpha/beta hydrolase [Amnibacterium sp.]|uniref:alpha/beta hydrolase n=1 Tax=Amnibacterium sp. TaxID=1872496 RepID=UPI003F7CABC5